MARTARISAGRTLATAVAVAGLLAALPASGVARPADVRIVNTPEDPANVRVTGTPTVKVDTADGPVEVRPTAKHFADSASLLASAGSSMCRSIEVQPEGRFRLTGIVASASGPGEPSVVMRLWSERDPQTSPGAGIRVDLPVPLQPMITPGGGFSWGGSVTPALMLGTGSLSALDGLGTDVSVCVQAPTGNSTTAHIYLSGEYL